jgi:hypothetical protein
LRDTIALASHETDGNSVRGTGAENVWHFGAWQRVTYRSLSAFAAEVERLKGLPGNREAEKVLVSTDGEE